MTTPLPGGPTTPVPVFPSFQLPPQVVELPSGKRVFDDAAIQAQLEKVLSGLPAGRTAAALDVGFDAQGIIVAGAVHFQDTGWTILGTYDRRKSGEWKGTVGVRWSK